jgi:hypothetical protein
MFFYKINIRIYANQVKIDYAINILSLLILSVA